MYAITAVIGSERPDELLLLLESGVDPNVRVPYSIAPDAPDVAIPLHLAVLHRWYEGTKLLLDYGADVNAQDDRGDTALMEAARQGLVEIARLLLDHGANPHLLDEAGCNALAFAVGSFEGEIVRMLRKAGSTMPPGEEFLTTSL